MQAFWLIAIPPFMFFVLAVLCYIPFKRLFIWLLSTKRLFDLPPAISLGIYENKKERVLLDNQFYYPLKFMLASVVLFSILYCFSFFSYGIDVAFPAYGLLLIFMFLEIYWFLNGKSELSEIEIKSIQPTEIDFYALWNDYKNTWADNLSLAFVKRSKYENWPSVTIGGEMLVKNYKQNDLFEKVEKHIVDLINKGKKIIIFIPDNFQPLKNLEDSNKYKIVREILFGSGFTSQFVTTEIMKLKLESSIYITSIDKFLQTRVNIESDYELFNWFKNVKLVLYFGYDVSLVESPESSVSASSIIKYLTKDPEDLTSIVFAEDRESQQASWQSNLKVNPQNDREIKINDSESENTYYLGWKAEKRFEAGLINNYANRYVGPLASLMGLPYVYHIKQVDIKPNKEPFNENYENAISYKEDWQDKYKGFQLLQDDDRLNYIKDHQHDLSITHNKDKVMIIYDYYHNAPFLYKYYNEFGQQNHLINIVSPPHILRQYFNDHFEYFSRNPIKPLSYMLIARDKYTLALTLLEKLVKCKLTIKELAQDFSNIEDNEHIVIKQLKKLFIEVYDFDIISTSYLLVSESKSGELSFSLKSDIKAQIELFKKVEFIDMTGNLVFAKNKNLLFQKYLKGQVHTFNGKMYKIFSISEIGGKIVVKLENTELRQNFSYMEKRKITLDTNEEWKKIESKNPTNEYALNIYSKRFTVSTSGYYELNDGNSLAKGRYTVHSTGNDVKDRVYENGRVCKVSFANYSSIPNFWKANLTLRIAFEEVLKVLFPDSFHYLIVRCFGANMAAPTDNIISQYYGLGNILESKEKKQFGIYIFEDSIFDMGHLKSIQENIEYIFKIIDDYFKYIIEKTQNQKANLKKLESHSIGLSEYFLAFELNKIKSIKDFSEPLDIQAAKNLTSKCVRIHNDITSDRWGNQIPSGPVKLDFMGACSSCQQGDKNQTNAALEDDGRVICNNCRKNFHRSQNEEKNLSNLAIEYFERNQNLPIVNQIRFTNLNEIRQNIDANASRFPHAAIKVNKRGASYEVLVENYRNDLETLTGLIHAFTHVWHMENLSVSKLIHETEHLNGHALLMIEQFLNDDNQPIQFSKADCSKLLRELKTYQFNYYQKAMQKLTLELDEDVSTFFYLIKNHGQIEEGDLEIVDY